MAGTRIDVSATKVMTENLEKIFPSLGFYLQTLTNV